jgi:hypothetical protein
MSTPRKTWVYRPRKPAPARVPSKLKAEVQQRAEELIESELKGRYVKPPPKGYDFNYVVEIHAKWYRHYFYFCAKYASPGPHAISPFFETKFARMEYVGGENFDLSYMRHTGEWIQVYQGMSLDECLTAIRDDPWFQA